MPAIAFNTINTHTFGSSLSAVTFSSIPSTYTDLRLVCTFVMSGSTDPQPILRFNSNTSAIYGQNNLWSNYGDTTLYARASFANNSYQMGAYFNSSDATQPRTHIIDIQNYKNTNTPTIGLSRNAEGSTTTASQTMDGFYFDDTSVINSLTISFTGSGTLAYGIATLYGITAA